MHRFVLVLALQRKDMGGVDDVFNLMRKVGTESLCPAHSIHDEWHDVLNSRIVQIVEGVFRNRILDVNSVGLDERLDGSEIMRWAVARRC